MKYAILFIAIVGICSPLWAIVQMYRFEGVCIAAGGIPVSGVCLAKSAVLEVKP